MPATGNRKAPGAYGRKSKPKLGRTKSEVGLGKSMAASGKSVSRTNLGKPSRSPSPKPPKAPRARRSPLATPEVQSAVERLRSRYADSGRTVEEARRQTEGNVRQRESRVDDIAAAQVQPNPAMSRTDFIGQQNQARQNTALSSDGKTVKKFRGKRIVGTPSTKSVAEAAREGSLRGKKRLTTPEVRQTKRQVRKARRQVRKARAQMQTPRKNLMRAGLDPEQARILTTVLKTGRKMGATKKELLAATMTALVESNISNPTVMTDHDSLGWRQERVSQYGTRNALDVRGGAKRFFEESVSDTGGTRGRGMLAGDLAQTIQGSAYPDRYEERRPEATALLRAFGSAGSASPKAKRRLERAKARAAQVDKRAKQLGIQGVRGESPNRVPKAGSPRFVNFSKGGVGTSNTKWLVPTGGNEVLKFQKPLADALIALAKASGEPIQVNSAYRSNEEQAALYQAYLNGTGNLAAPPGQSNHNHGAAVDVNLTARQRELAGQFGLGFPVSGEDWHMELVGDAANQLVSGGGGGGGSYPSSGGGTTPTTGGGVASGPSGRNRRQATIFERLRELGYRVNSKGVFKIGEGRQTKTEYQEAKERFGIK